MKKITLIFFVFLIILAIIYALFFNYNKVPNFSINTIDSVNTINNETLKNKVSIINFWYPSCPGCDREMDNLKKIYEKFSNHKNFQLIAIAANFNTKEQVEKYVNLRKLPFIIAYDKKNEIINLFKIEVMPVTIIVDKKTNIKKIYLGEPNWEQLSDKINKLLKNYR